MITLERAKELIFHSTEEDVLDFKLELPNLQDFAKKAELIRDIIALANSAYDRCYPEGYLIFGVVDKTKKIVGIQGQVLIEKAKEAQRFNEPTPQNLIDEFNQKKFASLVQEYIQAYKGNARVNYTTILLPESTNECIGFLSISPAHAPYTVKKAIPKMGDDGKPIRDDIEKSEAWIRYGEDKQKMFPQEIMEMREDAKEQNRRLKREKKLKEKLGSAFNNWYVDEKLDDIQDVEPFLPNVPLQTKNDLDNYLFLYRSLANQLDFIDQENWYLNNLIIEGSKGSGRTTLLRYLENLRNIVGGKSKIIWVQKIPNSPKLEEFLEVEEALGVKLASDSKRTIVIDSPKSNFDDVLNFIEQITRYFKYFHIWLACSPEDTQRIIEPLEFDTSSEKLLISLDYLNSNLSDFETLFQKILGNKLNPIDILSKTKNLTFKNLVEILNGMIGTPQEDIVNNKYDKLEILEKLLVKVLAITEKVDFRLANILVMSFNLPSDTIQNFRSEQILNIHTGLHYGYVVPTDFIPNSKLIITDAEIKLFNFMLEKIEHAAIGDVAAYSLANVIEQMLKQTKNATLSVELNRTKFRISGAVFCLVCEEFYDKSLIACPSCGYKKKQVNKEIMKRKEDLLLPFPNKELLEKGTFNLNRLSIDPKTAFQVNSGLPPFLPDRT